MSITLEESTTEKVPEALQQIIEKLIAEKGTDLLQRDLFFIVIVVLMTENGFKPLKNDVEIDDLISGINMDQLNKWRSANGIFDTKFTLYSCNSIPIKLIFSPLGCMVIINIIINNMNHETYTICLPVSRYVVSPQASTVPMMFRDLMQLSQTFKNTILIAVKSKILNFCGYPSASLIGLPEVIINKIMLLLPIKDIISTRKTCKNLYYMIDNNCLWCELYRRDFGNTINISEQDSQWTDLYKQAYLLKLDATRREQRRLNAGRLHVYMDHSDYVSHIENPLWDII